MNRLYRLAVLGTASLLSCTLQVAASRAVPIQVDGTVLQTQGWLTDGTTYAPLADLLSHWHLTWDAETNTAVATDGDNVLLADPGEHTITYNQDIYPAQVTIHQGRTYVPVRLVMEMQDACVQWDGYFDGVAVTSSQAPYNASDYYWLSRIISAESQGEILDGQIAVGNVVVTRVAAQQFPDSIPGVIFDTNHGVQFEPLSNATLFHDPTEMAQTAANAVLTGADVMGEALYFYAPALSQGTWIRENRMFYQTLGCHDFYL